MQTAKFNSPPILPLIWYISVDKDRRVEQDQIQELLVLCESIVAERINESYNCPQKGSCGMSNVLYVSFHGTNWRDTFMKDVWNIINFHSWHMRGIPDILNRIKYILWTTIAEVNRMLSYPETTSKKLIRRSMELGSTCATMPYHGWLSACSQNWLPQ